MSSNSIRSFLSLMIMAGLVSACSDVPDKATGHRVPVIYCTDLFHPHDDPDDHFDLAVIYALDELDIKGIVLDQGDKQDLRPGRIPVEQMNLLTGRSVPWEVGLSIPLKTPEDQALDQPAVYQDGAGMILDLLAESEEPLAIITVGSLRDVAVAFNRDPELFRKRVSKLVIFIGEASAGTLEWNVGLDPNAFICIMNSGLPIWWVPCFDGGNFRNNGNASFWKAGHSDLLRYASDRLINYFIYALLKRNSEDHLMSLDEVIDEQALNQVLADTRNLWCTAVFTSVAGRNIIKRDGEWISVVDGVTENPRDRAGVFSFVPISLYVDENARVVYEASSKSHEVLRFQIKDMDTYPEAMTSATAHLLGDL